MKACIIQPAYSTDFSKSDEYFEEQLKLLEQCDETMDMIVMPESCDIPCLASSKEEAMMSVRKFNEKLLKSVLETAKRCSAMCFVNARSKAESGLRNTTYCFDRKGEIVGKYDKQHLTPGEVSKMKLDSEYSFEFSEPTIVEMEGIRFAFMICYDSYFYEAFPNIARQNVDVIISCSHQRSDTHQALQIMTQFLAYNTNAYVVRSSVSMDESSNVGGASMVVSPDGTLLTNMYSRVGIATVDIDIKEKYYKPAGFANLPAAHYEYIEKGRRPWKYRPAGSAIVKPDNRMPYPRICAHRGFNTIAPENSMPAFGAAIALGAEEIEFDLWPTKDGEIVSCHDDTLDRVSDGNGKVYEHTYEELQKLDFGVKYGDKFKGLRIVLFEDILKKFGCHTIMNIHVKPFYGKLYDQDIMKKIVALICKYDCAKHVYFMLEQDEDIKMFKKYAPDIPVCVGHDSNRPWAIVDRAIALGAEKVQLYKPYFNQEMIDKAHSNGIRCNIFWSDDPEETEQFLAMGIDTLLTNDYNLISQRVQR